MLSSPVLLLPACDTRHERELCSINKAAIEISSADLLERFAPSVLTIIYFLTTLFDQVLSFLHQFIHGDRVVMLKIVKGD